MFIAQQGRRPDLRTDVPQAGIESPQPPLYYFVLGYGLRLTGQSFEFAHPIRNPDFSFERADSAPNYFIQPADRYEYVRILRGVSTVCGVIVLVGTYLAAALLGADRILRLGATMATAFLPQFTFVSSAISNDPLTAAVGSVAFVWLVSIARMPALCAWQPAVYGFLAGLAFLCKSHAIFLWPYGILVLVLTRSRARAGWMSVLWCSIGFLLPAAPYLGYNLWHYGDPTAVNMQVLVVPDLVTRRSLLNLGDLTFLGVFLPRLLFQSFLGVFGWMRIYLPTIFYALFGAFWAAALAGIFIALLRRRWDMLRQTLILAPVLAFLVVAFVNLTFTAPQGRYLFPALNAISLLFVFGAAELPAMLRRLILPAMPSFLLLTNLYSLWLVRTLFSMP